MGKRFFTGVAKYKGQRYSVIIIKSWFGKFSVSGLASIKSFADTWIEKSYRNLDELKKDWALIEPVPETISRVEGLEQGSKE